MQQHIVSPEVHEHHTQEQESLKTAGFWLFLVSDTLLFGTLFATYVVLVGHTNGGPSGKELFEIPGFVASTFLLLTSSFTSGLAVLQMQAKKLSGMIFWLIMTLLLGAAFLYLEVTEFVNLVHEGANIGTSAFLSAFFTLVGTHGIHVTVGIFWCIGLIFQLRKHGITTVTKRKISNFSLYWHFLDVIWIFLFSVVYLMGVM
ncbi:MULTISPECIES: cytochrome o ubiquinol oxidase subunit III [Paenibacillus]|uniref:cytochrome o ubiquinol oxidase subunit III n=1 Tax=Paenibacillus TaxID=44249 RepID=UPI000411CA16|nr:MULTISPECIES: cytochrome o ubiquinol oxidase subunit III [Paenibacillus]ASS65260.1 cytochrome o ubiquinol oxidase subunit III [Paenibacillus sp. RUD330]KKC46377.1 cytochrome o ubiquinol oxidase subunit III [Paenibacillus sp. D9]SIQ42339.1 cytochrome o ubiquinol oxidase subunit 3 [Paenibacillus sp. RU4X]SIQ64540.1 cytochrome o ubiquinol oxidase subunit 3 [Paenibacillus sp. RU4T]